MSAETSSANSSNAHYYHLEVRNKDLTTRIEEFDRKVQRKNSENGYIGMFYRHELKASLVRLEKMRKDQENETAELFLKICEIEQKITALDKSEVHLRLGNQKCSYVELVDRLAPDWDACSDQRRMERITQYEEAIDSIKSRQKAAKVIYEKERALSGVLQEKRKEFLNLQTLERKEAKYREQGRAKEIENQEDFERDRIQNSYNEILNSVSKSTDHDTMKDGNKTVGKSNLAKEDPIAEDMSTISTTKAATVVTSSTLVEESSDNQHDNIQIASTDRKSDEPVSTRSKSSRRGFSLKNLGIFAKRKAKRKAFAKPIEEERRPEKPKRRLSLSWRTNTTSSENMTDSSSTKNEVAEQKHSADQGNRPQRSSEQKHDVVAEYSEDSKISISSLSRVNTEKSKTYVKTTTSPKELATVALSSTLKIKAPGGYQLPMKKKSARSAGQSTILNKLMIGKLGDDEFDTSNSDESSEDIGAGNNIEKKIQHTDTSEDEFEF
eukprot:246387_1